MKYPMNLVEERFKRLNMDGRPVEFIPYPGDKALKVLTDALVQFDAAFDPNIRSKSQISKMPRIEELLASPEHCRLSDYTLQYRLCGKEGCNIFVRIGCTLRTPYIDVGVYNLRKDVLRQLDFPVNNPMDNDHFLTPTEVKTCIGSKNTSLGDILEIIPDSRQNVKQISRLAEAKVVDSDYTFAA